MARFTKAAWFMGCALALAAGCFTSPDAKVAQMVCQTDDNCPAGYQCAVPGAIGGCRRSSEGTPDLAIDQMGQIPSGSEVGGDRAGETGSEAALARDLAPAIDLPIEGPVGRDGDAGDGGREADVAADAPLTVEVGAIATGGSSGAGGASSAGGATGSGGVTSSGGVTNTGGVTGKGGATGSGGVTGKGGVTSSGGVTTTGGVTSTGGTSATGGTTAVGGTIGTGGSGTGGAPVCPSSHQCVARPPSGWSGPIVYAATSALAMCPATFPTEKVVGGLSVSTTSGTCDCACGSPTSTSCTGAVAQTSINYTCASMGGAQPLSVNGCIDVSGAASFQVTINPPTATCGSGSYGALTPATLTRQVRLCGDADEQANGCAATDQACLPRPAAGTQVCVYIAGSAACPAGYTTSSSIVYRSVKDDRTCPAGGCTCSASGGKCSASIFPNNSSFCTLSNGQLGSYGSDTSPYCISRAYGYEDLQGLKTISLSAATAPTCSGTSTPATGSAAGASPITVCCR